MPVRERVRRLFEIVHLRRQSHVTMRDLRSALSWLLLRDHNCDDVGRLFARTDAGATSTLRGSTIRTPSPRQTPSRRSLPDSVGPRRRDERAVDRLVRRLREADVGLVNEPALDRRLDHDPSTCRAVDDLRANGPMTPGT